MLNEQEKALLKIVADNEPVFRVVEKVFLSKFNTNFDVSKNNSELGEILRARLEGQAQVKDALKEILGCRTVEVVKKPENPAR